MTNFLRVLLFTSHLFASENSFVINGYSPIPGMDYQIEIYLQNPIENQKVILDCQSFINGLLIMEFVEDKWLQKKFFMISGNNCEDATAFAEMSRRDNRIYCLIVDHKKDILLMDYNLSRCEE